MEQKKILWVVASIAFFLVIVLGVAIYLNAPSKNNSTMSATEIADLGTIENEDTTVDPVKWTRDPNSIPPLEKEPSVPVNIQNNITVVNGEATEETKITGDDQNAVSVSSLTNKKTEEKETAALPESLAKDIEKDSPKKSSQKDKTVSNKKEKTGVIAKKGTLSKTTEENKKVASDTKAVEKKLPSKSKTKASKTQTTVSKKTVDIIYWIQTASLTSRLNAENARERLIAKHMSAEIFTKKTLTGITHRVRVGPFKHKTEAEYWLKRIRDIKGFEKSYVSQDRKKS